jgi:hypothetical protein
MELRAALLPSCPWGQDRRDTRMAFWCLRDKQAPLTARAAQATTSCYQTGGRILDNSYLALIQSPTILWMNARPSSIVMVRLEGSPDLRAWRASAPLTAGRLTEAVKALISVFVASPFFSPPSARTISKTFQRLTQFPGPSARIPKASWTFGSRRQGRRPISPGRARRCQQLRCRCRARRCPRSPSSRHRYR